MIAFWLWMLAVMATIVVDLVVGAWSMPALASFETFDADTFRAPDKGSGACAETNGIDGAAPGLARSAPPTVSRAWS